MKKILPLLVLVLLAGSPCPGQSQSEAGALVTRAERTLFTETTLYSEVLAMLHLLEQRSDLMRIEFFGTTAEGRPLPLAVLGNPPPEEPEEIDRERNTVVFIQANIHAGEVDGKEACLMLLRETAMGDLADLLDGTVLLVAPDFNADGNERISKQNRTRQNGPSGGVGIRANAQNLDLNRDYIKIESPEVRAHLSGVVLRWNPDLLVDCHTTNGALHEEPLCYSWSLNPLGDQDVARFDRDVLLPWVVERMRERDGYNSIPYGFWVDFKDPGKGWRTFAHQGRYATNYWGLRNRHSVLIETYSYADFETRVRSCFGFLHAILEATGRMGDEMRALVRTADEKGASGVKQKFYRKFKAEPLDELITIRGFLPGEGRPDPKNPGQPAVYMVPYFADFRPVDEGLPMPERGYVFPRGHLNVRDCLAAHGVLIEEITEDVTAEVQVFEIDEIKPAANLFQGHRNHTLTGKWVVREKTIPAGSWFVPTTQPLRMLAASLLEPESDDGLAYWNFMDRYLTRGTFDSSVMPYSVWRW